MVNYIQTQSQLSATVIAPSNLGQVEQLHSNFGNFKQLHSNLGNIQEVH